MLPTLAVSLDQGPERRRWAGGRRICQSSTTTRTICWRGPQWRPGSSRRRRTVRTAAPSVEVDILSFCHVDLSLTLNTAGKVYEAEKMVAANGKWYHKNCYRCVVCNNMLDSLNNNDGSDGNIYCRMCYRDKYGPQNRSSDIDLKARNTSSMKAEDPSRNCPRCGGRLSRPDWCVLSSLQELSSLTRRSPPRGRATTSDALPAPTATLL